MLQLQQDDRTFKKVINVLIETDDFYDSSDDGPDDEEGGVLCQWRGMLGNIPRPLDTQTQFIHGDRVCLVSEGGWYLIVASKAPNGRYDVGRFAAVKPSGAIFLGVDDYSVYP